MNTTLLITINETWFIPLDILLITCILIAIGLAIFFLFVIIFDKTCHTIPMLLVANSCLAQLLFASSLLSMSIFTLKNDFKQIQYQDSFCIFRAYMSYSLCTIQNCSYLVQSIYRYAAVVYPKHIFLRTVRTQFLFLSFSWIFAFIYPFEFLFSNEIIYNVDNQICQVPLRFSFSVIYLALCSYVIPIALIMFVYFILIRHVKEMRKNIMPVNILLRLKRELKMARRIVILIMILFISDFPYGLFAFISFFTTPPKYYLRIVFVFVNLSLPLVMICVFQFTDKLKASVMKLLKYRPNVIIPAIT